MEKLTPWHIKRFKAMTVPELFYRAGQMIQSKKLKKEIGNPSSNFSCSVKQDIMPNLDFSKLEGADMVDVFGIQIHSHEIKDWSFDFYTGKTFPHIYSKEINIRNDQYGSAKHVWEINRMLFLPQIAILFRKTKERKYLDDIKLLITSWVDQNPYLIGINWYSNIEINIRLINWFLTWELLQPELIYEEYPDFKSFIDETWIPCIFQHCSFSYMHPSLHSSSNNHLIAEYAGLFIAASKWHFNQSDKWKNYAKKGLENEILRQHSQNGINKEEAAEYIQFITDFFLICLLVGDYTNNSFSSEYKQSFRKIIQYISDLIDVNGNYPHYGDEDDGKVFNLNRRNETNNFISLCQAGYIYYEDEAFLFNDQYLDQKNLILFGRITEELSKKQQLFPIKNEKTTAFYSNEGHFIFKKQRGKKEIYLHFDAAKLGYLSIAAHGHADALSFVLHVDGQPFITDPGTYCYHTEPEWRQYFTSTRAHNTVCINQSNQATYIGPTLWLDHFNVQIMEFKTSDKVDYVIATHDGYKKIKIQHTRKIEFDKEAEKIRITDFISNKSGKEVAIELPFHIHPAIDFKEENHQIILIYNDRQVLITQDPQLQWQIVTGQINPILGWHSASFYHKEPSPVLIGELKSSKDVQIITELQIS